MNGNMVWMHFWRECWKHLGSFLICKLVRLQDIKLASMLISFCIRISTIFLEILIFSSSRNWFCWELQMLKLILIPLLKSNIWRSLMFGLLPPFQGLSMSLACSILATLLRFSWAFILKKRILQPGFRSKPSRSWKNSSRNKEAPHLLRK